MKSLVLNYLHTNLLWRYAIFSVFFIVSPTVYSNNIQYPRPPKAETVVISNDGLAIRFNIAWGGVVTAITDNNVAHGLNIVDSHDVGRELQVDQFLLRKLKKNKHLINTTQLMINPTQAGADGQQAFYKHPQGVIIVEKGSPVIHWKATRTSFSAVINPLDYDTGNPTEWIYLEHVRINRRGVAEFHYVFFDYGRRTYMMKSEVPTLYTDCTGTFMYPELSPYGKRGAVLRRMKNPHWPVKLINGAPIWRQQSINSKGWIANIDAHDAIGIFYTTPRGFIENYGTFPGAYVSNSLPLGKTNVVATNLQAGPGLVYSVRFSVLVSTPKRGPKLIAEQPAAVFKLLHK